MIYLASPYTHVLKDIRQERFELACLCAARLFQKGVFVFSPVVHTHPMKVLGAISGEWSYWKDFDHHMINLCEEVFVLPIPGWRESVGVKGEMEYAKIAGKPVKYVNLDGVFIPEPDL